MPSTSTFLRSDLITGPRPPERASLTAIYLEVERQLRESVHTNIGIQADIDRRNDERNATQKLLRDAGVPLNPVELGR